MLSRAVSQLYRCCSIEYVSESRNARSRARVHGHACAQIATLGVSPRWALSSPTQRPGCCPSSRTWPTCWSTPWIYPPSCPTAPAWTPLPMASSSGCPLVRAFHVPHQGISIRVCGVTFMPLEVECLPGRCMLYHSLAIYGCMTAHQNPRLATHLCG